MDVVHINQKQLATRWCISEATLNAGAAKGSVQDFSNFVVGCSTLPVGQHRVVPGDIDQNRGSSD